jgi:small GTP-binding protein
MEDLILEKQLYRKILIGGEGGVGKSTLLHRIISGEFQLRMQMTIGIDFRTYSVNYGDKQYILSLWDLGGQDRFRFIIPQYCQGAHAGIIMYDLTRLQSVFKIGEWVKLMRDARPKLPLLLVGSKADLIDQISVMDENIGPLMKEHKFYDHYKISSKTGEGIHTAILRIVEAIISYEQQKKEVIPEIIN